MNSLQSLKEAARNRPLSEVLKDMIGARFTRLTVLKFLGSKNKQRWWLCRCDCGKTIETCTNNLMTEHVRSCGCLHKELLSKRVRTHGMRETPFYNRWCDMKKRVFSKNNKSYSRYGGRGISVCESWLKFENFKKDMYQLFIEHLSNYGLKNTQLDRINPNGNYCPENCRWATIKQQSRNKEHTIILEYKGRKQSLCDWAEEVGITSKTLRGRIVIYKWPVERALTENLLQPLTPQEK